MCNGRFYIYFVGGWSGYMYIGYYNKSILDWIRRWDCFIIVGVGMIKICLLGEVRFFSNNDSVLLWINLLDINFIWYESKLLFSYFVLKVIC